MSAIIDKLADDLARDAIEAANALGDEELVVDIGNLLASSSTTAEEAFMTAARVRMALDRGRKMLNERIDRAAARLDAAADTSPE
ncbi:hypothetical protein [Planktotalea arctica]|uniref:hypothetical protein n=1 Tax=Planktotalea arctica TaxID=1481893 RepID=UPI000A175790|nr:hypothetical protein [Planktotalea arctica]